jgi:hypothetical protein
MENKTHGRHTVFGGAQCVFKIGNAANLDLDHD